MKTKSSLLRKVVTTLFLSPLFASNVDAQVDWKLSGNHVSADSKLGTNNGYDLIIETGNLERMRITDDGNVGFGLASPLFKVDVFGDMRLDGILRLEQYRPASGEEKKYLFVAEDGTMKGTTLRGGGGDGGLLQALYSGGCFPFTNGDGTVMDYPAPTWSSVGGDLDNASKIYTGAVCPALVGIGTSNPQFNLDVNGRTKTDKLGVNADPGSNTIVKIAVTGSQNDGLNLDFNSTNDIRVALKINTAENDDKALQINNTAVGQSVVDISGSGQIVLKPSSSTSRALVVKDLTDADVLRFGTDGTIWGTEVNVALKQDFPDYVFEKEYVLMPLGQLRDYLEEEKHLPNVPTAEAVKEHGLNLGEMQTIQMEKIEENTLYILQLEERLQKLEEQNAAMAKIIEELQNK